MLHETAVLGWARAETVCPDGFGLVLESADQTGVLVALENAPQTPQQRLAAQTRCFEARVDFLPIAPATHTSVNDAQAFASANAEALICRMNQLQGCGQMTLCVRLSCEDRFSQHTQSGRAWMQQRRAHKEAVAAQKSKALEVFDQISSNDFPTKNHATAGSLKRDVLVPRTRLGSYSEQMRTQAGKLETARISFTVTGLWPPFSFAQPFYDTPPLWD